MSTTPSLDELALEVARLTREVGILNDTQAVRTLQFKYGYYMDKGLYEEVVDLFAETGAIHFMGGLFKGRAGIRRLMLERFRQLFTGGRNGPVFGLLLEHMQLQDIVDVAPDRLSARGRFRALLAGGSHRSKEQVSERIPRQWWEGGVYENTYVREGGIWKLDVLNYNMFWQGDFDKGWAEQAPHPGRFFEKLYPEDPAGPDELTGTTPAFWPETPVVPFHYPHPVTGVPYAGDPKFGRRGS